MGHSKEWSTSSRLFGLLTQFLPFSQELVAHSVEWTTSSRLFRAFDPVSALSRGASNPVSALFLAFALISAFFLEARGLS